MIFLTIMMRCSLIIASYNEAENLKNCLSSIAEINYPEEKPEIIVIDNNSTDNTYDVVKNFPEIVYLQEKQQGASFARNKGILHSTGKILVFLDADTTVTKNWLPALVSPFEDPNIGAVGGRILPFNDKSIISRYLGISLFMRYPQYKKRKRIKGFPSCNLAVRKKIIGSGFDTKTFNTYGEDKDICYRIIKKGYTVLFSPEAVIYHQHPETFSSFIALLKKSSKGRFSFGRLYPFAPDIIFLNFHIPIIYPLLLLYSIAFVNISMFITLLLPFLLYLTFSSIIAFVDNHNFILSFFIKPVLDIIAVFTIYFSYHSFKIRDFLSAKRSKP